MYSPGPRSTTSAYDTDTSGAYYNNFIYERKPVLPRYLCVGGPLGGKMATVEHTSRLKGGRYTLKGKRWMWAERITSIKR